MPFEVTGCLMCVKAQALGTCRPTHINNHPLHFTLDRKRCIKMMGGNKQMVVALTVVDCELNEEAGINRRNKIKDRGKKKASEPT